MADDLDAWTADRILAGAVGPDDAPPGYGRVPALLGTLREAGGPDPDPAVVASMVAEIAAATARGARPGPRRRPMRSARTLTAAVIGGFALGTGAAAALAGDLPEPAQDAVARAADQVGFELPASWRADDAGPPEGTDAGADGDEVPDPAVEPESQGKGAEISELATTTELTGVDKGAAISDLASDGHSRAGEGGPPAETPVGPPEGAPPEGAGTPAGPPAGVPVGPPAETPAGPPANTPVGPPVDPPAGAPVDPPTP